MKRSRIGLSIAFGVIVLIVGIYALRQGFRRTATPPTTPPPETPPPARSSMPMTVANINPIEVAAQTWVDVFFTLPAKACTLTGHVEGISGGEKDFEGFVMDNEEYRNWSSGQPPKGTASGRVVVWDPKVSLQGLDTFHLVVSNTLALSTPKVISVRSRLTCP